MKNNDIIITAVGDIQLSRDIKTYIEKCEKNNYSNIFKYVKKYISDSDISLGNLESVISNTKNKTLFKKGPSFRASTHSIEALNNSGLNTINISNNHSNDYGDIAIKDTIDILYKNNYNILGLKNKPYKLYTINNLKIIIFGLSKPFYKLKNNKNVYVYNEYTNKLIKNLKKSCDILIITIHWGNEYVFNNNDRQKKIAEKMIENGADIIIGHHPHVIQNMEKINIKNKSGYVFYSLGNFVFDSHYNKSGVRNSMILKIKINKDTKKYTFEYLPCTIYPKLGFIPKPNIKKFVKQFPNKNTKKANNLFKNVFTYLDNCMKGGEFIYKNNNLYKLPFIIHITLLLFLIYCILHYYYF